MRISDWSSDACSSDLLQLTAQCYVHDGMSLMLRFCEDLVKHTAIVEIFDLRCFPAAEILAYGDQVQLRENARIFSGHLGVSGAIEIPGERLLRGRRIKILQIVWRAFFSPVLFGILLNLP